MMTIEGTIETVDVVRSRRNDKAGTGTAFSARGWKVDYLSPSCRIKADGMTVFATRLSSKSHDHRWFLAAPVAIMIRQPM
jgi:hypothetical protein